MDTIVLKMESGKPDGEGIRKAGEIIRNGGLVAFPTETVYGLGGDALNPESSQKIYAAKGRPSDNPLIIHICKWEDIYVIADPVTEEAEKLAEAFWPGPLTIILKKTDRVPTETTGGLDTVAIRFPQHPLALSFIEAAGGFVAAPSANLSGRPSPTLSRYVLEDMDGRIEMILDGGEVGIGLESTIVDLTGKIPVLLRPGYITMEMLKGVLGRVETDPTILDVSCAQRPKAPGMRYKHYAPKGALTIVEGAQESVTAVICEKSRRAKAAGERVGIIATDETVAGYRQQSMADSIKSAGKREDERAVAKSLYRILREFDEEKVTVIYSESFSDSGFGQAIMNRLLKAAGHHVEQI